MQIHLLQSRPSPALLLALILPMLAVFSGGCAEQDPIAELRERGVIVTRDRDRRERIAKVKLPSDADKNQLAEILQLVARLDTLGELDCSGTQITDDGLKSLNELVELKKLWLHETAISDEGLKYLRELPSLEEVSLYHTRVEAASLVEQLALIPTLVHLDMASPAAPERPGSRTLGGAFRLGIDLRGGAYLVFQANAAEARALGKELTKEVMAQMVASIIRRVNPSGTEEVSVRQIGADRIEVIIPGADRQAVDQKKRMITKLGSLEFGILANGRDHQSIISQAQGLPVTEDAVRQGAGRVVARWIPIAAGEEVGSHGQVEFRTVRRESEELQQVLVMVQPESQRVTGQHLFRVSQTVDENGRPAVSFQFKTRGASLFERLTRANQPEEGFERRLAILLDNKVHSAPTLQDVISYSGRITGSFTQQEINELINVLESGALEVPLHEQPISEMTISPTLGADVQRKGITAIAIAAVAVVLFMILYYRFAGIVAVVCLGMNLLLVMGTMVFINATFTLPGLAALVLTIGMAVDANVLIFERIREEQARGSSVRMAIHNGFARAFTTIVDANVTTLIVAVVLYMIGTDQVRGFAVTLFIGIVMSMFTALYVGRLLFELWERKLRPKALKMNSVVPAGTKLDFIGKRRVAAIVSLVLILGGLFALVDRGKKNLDIDFSGGTAVAFQFVELQDIGKVKQQLALDAAGGGGGFGAITVERLVQEGEDPNSPMGRRFRMRTTETDEADVRARVDKAFASQEYALRKLAMDFTGVTPLPKSEPDESDEPDVAAADPYSGGNQTELTFKVIQAAADTEGDRIQAGTVQAYLADALTMTLMTSSAEGGEVENAESLFKLTPLDERTSGKGATRWQVAVMASVSADDLKSALRSMREALSKEPLFDEVNSFDSSVAADMQTSAVMAMLISLVAIVGYIWFRFQRIDFGLAAVVALVHDVLVVVGMVAVASYADGYLGLRDFKINLPMIAAFLTIIGYSLNDTIVVFDRIREVRGRNPKLTGEMINTSLNQTLARTLLTSLTTMIVVGILFIFGGEGIHGFAFCLVVGVAVGTYSSIFVASPVLLALMNRTTIFHRLYDAFVANRSSRRAPARG